ncbi:MAG: hypothetical protein PW786_12530 [Arachidicoccus sp.]|nr:hypothetical protein [Arachidicoccus sp.]
MKKLFVVIIICTLYSIKLNAQHHLLSTEKRIFTHADTLRGTNGANRSLVGCVVL